MIGVFRAARVHGLADRVAMAMTASWSWSAFDRIVGEEAGLTVTTIETDALSAGEISGVAVRSECGSRAVIAVPSSVSLSHRIHIAAHEAWHLIAGHSGCSTGPGELAAEDFARRVGERVALREMHGGAVRWLAAVGAV